MQEGAVGAARATTCSNVVKTVMKCSWKGGGKAEQQVWEGGGAVTLKLVPPTLLHFHGCSSPVLNTLRLEPSAPPLPLQEEAPFAPFCP